MAERLSSSLGNAHTFVELTDQSSTTGNEAGQTAKATLVVRVFQRLHDENLVGAEVSLHTPLPPQLASRFGEKFPDALKALGRHEPSYFDLLAAQIGDNNANGKADFDVDEFLNSGFFDTSHQMTTKQVAALLGGAEGEVERPVDGKYLEALNGTSFARFGKLTAGDTKRLKAHLDASLTRALVPKENSKQVVSISQTARFDALLEAGEPGEIALRAQLESRPKDAQVLAVLARQDNHQKAREFLLTLIASPHPALRQEALRVIDDGKAPSAEGLAEITGALNKAGIDTGERMRALQLIQKNVLDEVENLRHGTAGKRDIAETVKRITSVKDTCFDIIDAHAELSAYATRLVANAPGSKAIADLLGQLRTQREALFMQAMELADQVEQAAFGLANDEGWVRATLAVSERNEGLKTSRTFFIAMHQRLEALAHRGEVEGTALAPLLRQVERRTVTQQAHGRKYLDQISRATERDAERKRLLSKAAADLAEVQRSFPSLPETWRAAEAGDTNAQAKLIAERRGEIGALGLDPDSPVWAKKPPLEIFTTFAKAGSAEAGKRLETLHNDAYGALDKLIQDLRQQTADPSLLAALASLRAMVAKPNFADPRKLGSFNVAALAKDFEKHRAASAAAPEQERQQLAQIFDVCRALITATDLSTGVVAPESESARTQADALRLAREQAMKDPAHAYVVLTLPQGFRVRQVSDVEAWREITVKAPSNAASYLVQRTPDGVCEASPRESRRTPIALASLFWREAEGGLAADAPIAPADRAAVYAHVFETARGRITAHYQEALGCFEKFRLFPASDFGRFSQLLLAARDGFRKDPAMQKSIDVPGIGTMPAGRAHLYHMLSLFGASNIGTIVGVLWDGAGQVSGVSHAGVDGDAIDDATLELLRGVFEGAPGQYQKLTAQMQRVADLPVDGNDGETACKQICELFEEFPDIANETYPAIDFRALAGFPPGLKPDAGPLSRAEAMFYAETRERQATVERHREYVGWAVMGASIAATLIGFGFAARAAYATTYGALAAEAGGELVMSTAAKEAATAAAKLAALTAGRSMGWRAGLPFFVGPSGFELASAHGAVLRAEDAALVGAASPETVRYRLNEQTAAGANFLLSLAFAGLTIPGSKAIDEAARHWLVAFTREALHAGGVGAAMGLGGALVNPNVWDSPDMLGILMHATIAGAATGVVAAGATRGVLAGAPIAKLVGRRVSAYLSRSRAGEAPKMMAFIEGDRPRQMTLSLLGMNPDGSARIEVTLVDVEGLEGAEGKGPIVIETNVDEAFVDAIKRGEVKPGGAAPAAASVNFGVESGRYVEHHGPSKPAPTVKLEEANPVIQIDEPEQSPETPGEAAPPRLNRVPADVADLIRNSGLDPDLQQRAMVEAARFEEVCRFIRENDPSIDKDNKAHYNACLIVGELGENFTAAFGPGPYPRELIELARVAHMQLIVVAGAGNAKDPTVLQPLARALRGPNAQQMLGIAGAKGGGLDAACAAAKLAENSPIVWKLLVNSEGEIKAALEAGKESSEPLRKAKAEAEEVIDVLRDGTIIKRGKPFVKARAVSPREIEDLATYAKADPDAFSRPTPVIDSKKVAEEKEEIGMRMRLELSRGALDALALERAGRQFDSIQAKSKGGQNYIKLQAAGAEHPELAHGKAALENYLTANEAVLKKARSGDPLSFELLQTAHNEATQHLPPEQRGHFRGAAKSNDVALGERVLIGDDAQRDLTAAVETNPDIRVEQRNGVALVEHKPAANEVEKRVKEIIKDLNESLDNEEEDPFTLAARVTRQWVSVSPFSENSELTAQLLVNYIFDRARLSAPIIEGFSEAPFLSPEEWKARITKGFDESQTLTTDAWARAHTDPATGAPGMSPDAHEPFKFMEERRFDACVAIARDEKPGLSIAQIAEVYRDEATFNGDNLDPLTGIPLGEDRIENIEAVRENVRATGESAHYSERDAKNIKAMPKEKGDKLIIGMAKIAQQEYKWRAGATSMSRHGGDENSNITVGLTDQACDEADKRTEKRYRHLAKKLGVTKIPHHKGGGRPDGTDVTTGRSRIGPTDTIQETLQGADLQIEDKKARSSTIPQDPSTSVYRARLSYPEKTREPLAPPPEGFYFAPEVEIRRKRAIAYATEKLGISEEAAGKIFDITRGRRRDAVTGLALRDDWQPTLERGLDMVKSGKASATFVIVRSPNYAGLNGEIGHSTTNTVQYSMANYVESNLSKVAVARGARDKDYLIFLVIGPPNEAGQPKVIDQENTTNALKNANRMAHAYAERYQLHDVKNPLDPKEIGVDLRYGVREVRPDDNVESIYNDAMKALELMRSNGGATDGK